MVAKARVVMILSGLHRASVIRASFLQARHLTCCPGGHGEKPNGPKDAPSDDLGWHLEGGRFLSSGIMFNDSSLHLSCEPSLSHGVPDKVEVHEWVE